jgi:hypothetical protein
MMDRKTKGDQELNGLAFYKEDVLRSFQMSGGKSCFNKSYEESKLYYNAL